jgi:hypothetical protein
MTPTLVIVIRLGFADLAKDLFDYQCLMVSPRLELFECGNKMVTPILACTFQSSLIIFNNLFLSSQRASVIKS